MTMIELFQAARRVSVPILVIRSADQAATIEATRAAAGSDDSALIQWDAATGLSGLNKAGSAVLRQNNLTPETTAGFVEAMVGVQKLPQGAICYVKNAQRQLQSLEPLGIAAAVQAVSNVRDVYKRNHRTLVLLMPTGAAPMPAELDADVVILDHELPGPVDLRTIVADIYESAKQPVPKDDDATMQKAIEAVSGLSAFAAEQAVAMSFTAQGLDLHALWERKRVAIEQTPGLSVWRGRERFADLIGLEQLKGHLRRRMQATRPIGVVVWIDEIDKALANVESDSTGVRMYQLLKLLVEMENNEWPGFVGVGLAGAGKSLIAKAFGNEAGVPTIALDLGATESKYVGESEANMLRALQIIKAIGRGHAYFIATSNAATVMRPELQRRFTDGLWMFDLMTVEERRAAWAFYLAKYQLGTSQVKPDDDAWTGAEIRNCCRYAAETGCNLLESAQLIIPMARGRWDDIERLRRFAHGKFLDVSRPGPYQYESEPMRKQIRAIELPVSAQQLVGMKES